MTTDPLAAQIAAVLGEHAEFYPDGCCCEGYQAASKDVFRHRDAHRAHVAQILAELVGGDGLAMSHNPPITDMDDPRMSHNGDGLRAGVDVTYLSKGEQAMVAAMLSIRDALLDPSGMNRARSTGALLDQRGEGEK